MPCYKRVKDELIFQVYQQHLKLQYHLVDSAHFTILEPINHRTFLKLFQAVIQSRSAVLFDPYGLQNLCCRIMKHLLLVTQRRLSFQHALIITDKNSVLFYYLSQGAEQEQQFYDKVRKSFNAINSSLLDTEKKTKGNIISSRELDCKQSLLFI